MTGSIARAYLLYCRAHTIGPGQIHYDIFTLEEGADSGPHEIGHGVSEIRKTVIAMPRAASRAVSVTAADQLRGSRISPRLRSFM